MNDGQDNPRRNGGCIYCGSKGPFSDEHVVSAGLGGDDGNWLLKNCVCAVCNTKIFSKLETKVLRSSPVALARLFSQPYTRGGTPSVQPKSSFLDDPKTGNLLETELGPGGASEVLPQLLLTGAGEAAVTGANAAAVEELIDRLQKELSDAIVLIEKTTDGFEVRYSVTPLSWSEDAYALGQSTTELRPPKNGFWLEPLNRPETAKEGRPLLPRVFRRIGGQLVCRAGSADHAALLLTIVRNSPDVVAAKSRLAGAETVKVEEPGIHQHYRFDLAAYDRVLTKIGLNLVAKLLGTDFMRGEAFDAAVSYAREGKGGIHKHSAENAAANADFFGKALLDRHVLALVRGPGANGGHTVIFMCRFYGGPLEAIRLADTGRDLAELEHPLLIHVDYVNNTIVRKTLEEHVIDVANAL